MSILKVEQGILAPLRVEDETLGLMMVSGLGLDEGDVPAMESFAIQVAAGLQNARLMQKLQQELETRRQVEESLSHNRNMLLALSRTAQAIQRVWTPEEIYQVIGEQINALGFEVTILTLDSEHKHLQYSYTALSKGIIRTAEKMTGQVAQGYTWSISPDSIYGKIIETGKAEYIPLAFDLFAEALPKPLRPSTKKIMRLLGVEQGILAPLHVDEETLGLMCVFGSKDLSQEELPAIDSFAGQVAVSLRNARLAQQMQEELSARRLAEEKLQASLSTSEGVFNSITEAIYILDENGLFLNVNLGAEKMYGYPSEYFIGRTPEFLSAPGKNDFAKVVEYIHRAYRGEIVEFEFWGCRTDGSIFPKDVRLTPGTYFGQTAVIAVGRDVTERKQAEEAVRQAESHFKALIENAPDGIVLVGLDGKTQYVSPSARNLFDYETEDGINVNPLDFIHPDDLFIVIGAMNDLIQNPAYIPTLEYRYKHKSGSYHWVESTFSNLLAEPSVQAVVINFRDITERKQVEEALKQSEARYRLLADHTTDTIWTADLNLKTTYISPSVEKIRGFTMEQLQELPLEQNITPHSLQLAMDAFAVEIPKVYANPDYSPVIALELEFFNQDGTIYSTESKLSIIRDESGNPISILGESRDIADRKRVEKALYESERYYRALIENAADGILVVNPDGTIRYESPSVARMLGYAPNALVGTSAFDLIYPEDLAQIANAFMEGLSTPGFLHRGEYRLRHCSGELRHIEIVTRYLLEDPVIAGIIINGRDITDRKQAETVLRESEIKFHSVITESVDGIVLTDEDGRIIEFNNAHEKITGQTRDEMLGQFVWDVHFQLNPDRTLIPEFHERQKKSLQLALETGRAPFLSQTQEVPFKYSDGSVRFLQQRSFAMQTKNGWRLGSIARDITDRKRSEEALHASEERYRALYDDNPSMYFTAGASGRILSVNKFGLTHLGYREDELAGQPIFNIFYPDDRANVQQQFNICLQNPKQTIQIESRKIRKDGTMLWVRESACAVHNIQGQLIVLLTCDDITERKRAEDALQASEERSKTLYQLIRLMSDNLPDLVWAKDMDGRYLFANKAMAEKMLIAQDTDEPIGKTDFYFVERQRSLHPEKLDWHTFGEICVNSDGIVHSTQHAERFEEFGNIQGEFLFLDVYKAPFLNELGHMIGTVGIGRDVTNEKKLEQERRQTQESLAASEAEMRAVFASMQDVVFVIARNGDYLKIAPTNPDKLYISPEEVIGKHLTDFFPLREVERFLGVMQRVLDTQQILQVEYELVVNGQAPWFEASISPMGSDHTLWVARDISERKQVEAKLQLQSAALEAAANTIVITDRDGLIQWANSAFEGLTGYDPKEVLGRRPSDLVKSGRQSQQFYKELWDTILSGNIWHNELINRRKDGSLYFEEMTITPLQNTAEEIHHFIAVKQNITERKQAEAALIKSEQEYRTLFENMPIGLYRTSVGGQVLDANPALVRMFGFQDLPSFLSMKAESLYADPIFEARFQENIKIQDALAGFEAQFRRQDDTIFWAEDYVRVVRDEDGNPLFFEGSLVDITERRKSEIELRRTNALLEAAHRDLQKMFAHEQFLARTDDLTGLYNRRHFFELASRQFDTSIRYRYPLTVILFDADGFKQANDTFGHAMGDNILIQIAQTTAAQVRDVDVLARYGGDEFIILLPQTNAEQAYLMAERIRESVAVLSMKNNESAFFVTLSIGVAEIDLTPQDQSIENVIHRADQALYEAKQSGRNHTIIYNKKT